MKHALTVAFLLMTMPVVAAPQSLSPPDQSDSYFRVGNGVSPPSSIYHPDPKYTKEARKAHIQGKVVLSFVVRADGTVGDIKVTKSLDKGLDENAMAAVKRWRFKPAEKNGEPVAVLLAAEVAFHLDGGRDPVTPPPNFPDSKIEALSDGRRVLTNSPIGVRIALPAGWSQVNYHEGTYSSPPSMTLNRSQTLALVELVRQTLDASPSLYRKVFRSALERAFQNIDIIGEEAIKKPEWDGMRLLVLGTQKDIKMRCMVDIYTRENQHHVVDACAPDELFAKYRQDFDTMLKSVEFSEFALSTADDNR
jgi:TonB family protein